MRPQSFTCFATGCLLLVSPVLATAAWSRDCAALLNKPVMATLSDGRTPRGVLSPKSGDDGLVLRTEVPGVAIESRFAWEIVQAIEALPFAEAKPMPRPADPVPDDEDAAPASPVEQVPDNAVPPAPTLPEARRPITNSPLANSGLLPIEANEFGPFGFGPTEVPLDVVMLDHRRAVKSLTIKATVANWDQDAEVDGLLLHVQPLDGFGIVVPVEGNLDVQLATEATLVTGGRSIRRDDSFRITERWSVPIHVNQFDATGTVVKLPFRRFHPERHFDIASDALALARLRLPTAGAFDASDPFVQLRPASRFRDDLQLQQSRRLYPGEGTPRW